MKTPEQIVQEADAIDQDKKIVMAAMNAAHAAGDMAEYQKQLTLLGPLIQRQHENTADAFANAFAELGK